MAEKDKPKKNITKKVTSKNKSTKKPNSKRKAYKKTVAKNKSYKPKFIEKSYKPKAAEEEDSGLGFGIHKNQNTKHKKRNKPKQR